MKIAYLVTAYGEFEHLKRLVNALNDTDVGFFIHIDAKSDMPDGLFAGMDNVVMVPRRKVWWGGWSHTDAILTLMREAVKGDFDYCILMSGGDYPVRSNQTIRKTLSEGGEFINALPGFRHDKSEKRVKYYYIDGYDRRKKTPATYLFVGVERILKLAGIRKRKYPFDEIYVGTVWSALSMGCVKYILDFVDSNPRFVRFFRTSWVPEEAFFQTIIGNSHYAGSIRGTLTYMDWDDGPCSPAVVGRDHLPLLAPGVTHEHKPLGRTYEPLFARKFNDRSAGLLDEIDATLRTR